MINFKRKQKGFTFIELMIAVFIFALMMITITEIFSSSISGYQKAKITQKNLEDAQFIMNQMAKTLRTSSVISNSTSSIKVYDYSTGKCYNYKFEGNTVKVGSYAEDIEGEELSAVCSNNFSLSLMAAFYVESGVFDTIPSDPGDGSDGVLGKVTVAMSICQISSSCERDRIRIQSSVSLRDYYNAGI
ncbi:prepilin-type N-terminal cleavage/methylation domain-containing protein [Patescibacteria group bacterium]|nr:prepilin-type N-terminal cleavage/methylation domain-containing protein [Patescibacteria group bacterium]